MFFGDAVKYLDLALLVYVVLSLILPYMLAGDRGLTTFTVYVLLSVAAVATAALRLKRWSRVG